MVRMLDTLMAAGAPRDGDELKQLRSALEALLDDKKLWAHAKHASALIRRGLYVLIKAIVRYLPGTLRPQLCMLTPAPWLTAGVIPGGAARGGGGRNLQKYWSPAWRRSTARSSPLPRRRPWRCATRGRRSCW